MKTVSVIFLLFLLPCIYKQDPFKMLFDVEYDKSAKKYNLVINKKKKIEDKTKTIIERKTNETSDLIINKYRELANKLKRALSNRKNVTKSSDMQFLLEKLNDKVSTAIDKSNNRTKMGISRAYDKANQMYRKMVDRFAKSGDEFKNNSANKQKRITKEIVKKVEKDYRNQSKVLQRELSVIKRSLHIRWNRITKAVTKTLTKLKKKDNSLKNRKKSGKNMKDNLKFVETKTYDKKIDKYARELETNHLSYTITGLINAQKIATKNFISLLNKSVNNITDGDKDDPLAMVGLESSPRVLESMSKLIKLTPPWLAYNKPIKLPDKSKNELFKYKKSMIKETIDDLKAKKWTIIKRHRKRYAYFRRLNLYVPVNKHSSVNSSVIKGLISKLENNYRRLENKSAKPDKNKPGETKAFESRVIQTQENNSSINTLANTNETSPSISQDNSKNPRPQRKNLLEVLGGAATGGVMGIAGGLMKGSADNDKLKIEKETLEKDISRNQMRFDSEQDNFRKLFNARVQLKQAVNAVHSVTKMLCIRLDAKRDDLNILLIEQEIY